MIHIITGIFGQEFWQIKIGDVLPAAVTDFELYWILQVTRVKYATTVV